VVHAEHLESPLDVGVLSFHKALRLGFVGWAKLMRYHEGCQDSLEVLPYEFTSSICPKGHWGSMGKTPLLKMQPSVALSLERN